MNTITIITEPIPRNVGERLFFPVHKKATVIRRYIGALLKGKRLLKHTISPQYGGHPAVTRSLIEGLTKLSVNFVLNPTSIKNVTSIVVDLSSVPALKQLLQLKNIQTLIVGPNLMNLSTDHEHILDHANIDAIIVPSEWTKKLYTDDLPSIKDKIEIWPAGVDEAYWKPQINTESKNAKKNILLYWKHHDKNLLQEIKKSILDLNYSIQLIEYGSYSKKEYYKALSRSVAMVFVSQSESEGIAALEAWSMDVPTFCFQSTEPLLLSNKQILYSSPCPYLSDSTGSFWKTTSELKDLLKGASQKNMTTYKPRKWLLEHLTDVHSVKILLSIIEKYSSHAQSHS